VGVTADGLLTGAKGQLMDTQGSGAHIREQAEANRHLYAMDDAGKIAVGRLARGDRASVEAARAGGPNAPSHVDHIHHSSFFEGDAVDAKTGKWDAQASKGVKGAGELDVKQGWLKNISNNSGHYTPDGKQLANTISTLQDQGVNHRRQQDRFRLPEPPGQQAQGREEGVHGARVRRHRRRHQAPRHAQGRVLGHPRRRKPAEAGAHPRPRPRARTNASAPGRRTQGQARARDMAGEAPGQGQGEDFARDAGRFASLEKGLPAWAHEDQKNHESHPLPEISRQDPEPEPEMPAQAAGYEAPQAPVEEQPATAAAGGQRRRRRRGSRPGTTWGATCPWRRARRSCRATRRRARRSCRATGTTLGGRQLRRRGGFVDHISLSESESSSEEDPLDGRDTSKDVRRFGGWERKTTADGGGWDRVNQALPDGVWDKKGKSQATGAEPTPKMGGANGSKPYANEQNDHFGVRPTAEQLDPSIGVGTKYYDDEEREARRLTANKDGLLTGADGKAFDTTKAGAHNLQGAQAGRHIFGSTRRRTSTAPIRSPRTPRR
jgi:hypothetical protein